MALPGSRRTAEFAGYDDDIFGEQEEALIVNLDNLNFDATSKTRDVQGRTDVSEIKRTEGFDALAGKNARNQNPLDRERPYEETSITNPGIIDIIKLNAQLDGRERFKRFRMSEFMAARGMKWSVSSNYPTLSRRKMIGKIHRALKETFRNQDCLVFTDNIYKQGNVRVIKRIGSDSVYGQVYLGSVILPTSGVIETGQYPQTGGGGGGGGGAGKKNELMIEQKVAIKVMPITREDSYQDNIKELEAMYNLSRLVLEGKSANFPVVFVDSACLTTMIGFEDLPGGILARRSAQYGTFERLTDIVFAFKKQQMYPSRDPTAEERSKLLLNIRANLAAAGYPDMSNYIEAMYKNTLIPEADVISAMIKLNNIKSLYMDTNAMFSKASELLESPYLGQKEMQFNPSIQIRSNIVVMELAKTDVRTKYIDRDYTVKSTYDMILQLVDGVIVMQTYYGYIHNDLHTGNVLVIEDYVQESSTTYTRYLITDFGRIQRLQDISNAQERRYKYLEDIERFIQVLMLHVIDFAFTIPESKLTMDLLKIAADAIASIRNKEPRQYANDMIYFKKAFLYGADNKMKKQLQGFQLYSPKRDPVDLRYTSMPPPQAAPSQQTKATNAGPKNESIPPLPRKTSTKVLKVVNRSQKKQAGEEYDIVSAETLEPTTIPQREKKSNVPPFRQRNRRQKGATKSLKKQKVFYFKPLGENASEAVTKHTDDILCDMMDRLLGEIH